MGRVRFRALLRRPTGGWSRLSHRSDDDMDGGRLNPRHGALEGHCPSLGDSKLDFFVSAMPATAKPFVFVPPPWRGLSRSAAAAPRSSLPVRKTSPTKRSSLQARTRASDRLESGSVGSHEAAPTVTDLESDPACEEHEIEDETGRDSGPHASSADPFDASFVAVNGALPFTGFLRMATPALQESPLMNLNVPAAHLAQEDFEVRRRRRRACFRCGYNCSLLARF